MSEKRFILAEDSNGLFSIFDNEDIEDEPLIYGARFGTEKIVDLLNEQQATITHLEEECKEKLDTFDKAEIEAINIIYEEKGFDGVIEYSRQKLYNYGAIKEKNGLVMMATGGWSDNEDYLYCLNHLLSNFGRNHYVGYLRGGAFYYSKDKYNIRTEIVVIDDE